MRINRRFAAALRHSGLPVPLDYLMIDAANGVLRLNARGRTRFARLCGPQFVRGRMDLRALVGRLAHAGAFMEASSLIYLFGPYDPGETPAEGPAPGEIRAIVQFARQCRSLGYQDEAGKLVAYANDEARAAGFKLPELVFEKIPEERAMQGAVGAA